MLFSYIAIIMFMLFVIYFASLDVAGGGAVLSHMSDIIHDSVDSKIDNIMFFRPALTSVIVIIICFLFGAMVSRPYNRAIRIIKFGHQRHKRSAEIRAQVAQLRTQRQGRQDFQAKVRSHKVKFLP